jgi:iron complex transport system permease protein
VLVAALSLGRGDYPISVPQVLGTLVGAGDETARFIVLELRAPRIAVAVLVGAALGISGALIQTFARNPLASPDVLGVTGGAAIGAVGVIVLGGSGTTAAGVLGGIGLPAAALLGGLVMAGLIFGLAWQSGIDGYRLVLVGVGLSAMAQAVVSYLLTRSSLFDAAAANVWLTGSLNGRGWDQARPLAIALVVLLPVSRCSTCCSSATTPPARWACGCRWPSSPSCWWRSGWPRSRCRRPGLSSSWRWSCRRSPSG